MSLKEIKVSNELENKLFNPFSKVGTNESPLICEKYEEIRSNCKYFSSPVICRTNHVENHLNILHVNLRSILSDSKFEEFKIFVSCSNDQWQVICVSESWLTDDITQLRQLDGFTGYFKNRKNRTGGGVIVYLNDMYIKHSSEIEIDGICMESMFVQCQLSTSFTFIVGQLYNPPSMDTTLFVNEINHCLEKLDKMNKTTFLCGDFNIDLFSLYSDNHCQEFFNTMLSFGYWPTISKTTRASDNKLSLLDNIFCNNIEFVSKSGIIHEDSSDHFPIFVSCSTHLSPQKAEFNTVFDNSKFEELSAYLSDHLQNFAEMTDPEAACNFLLKTYQSGIQEFSKTIKHSRKTTALKPWVSPAILASINRRYQLFLNKSNNPTEQNKHLYNEYRNRLNGILREAKKNYVRQQLEVNKTNSKKLWQMLNETVRGTNSNNKLSNTFLNSDGEHTSDKHDIAESFNSFFISIGDKLQQEIPTRSEDPLSHVQTPAEHILNLLHNTNSAELGNTIKQMKNVGAGIDGINANIFKHTYLAIINELVHLINICLANGVFPSALKMAVIKPVFKSGDKKVFNNYRPISILPYISKLLEKVIHLRIMTYLDNANILSSCQFGFQKNRSTYMPMLLLQENITKSFEKGNITCGLYLDLKKAFDTVDHTILVGKLEKYGFANSALNIIKSYLSNRKQCVEYYGARSTFKLVKIGVPQGSILGPLLFLLYINDFPNISQNIKFLLYADDTAIFFESDKMSTLQQLVDTECTHICNWLEINKLSLNTQKTVFQLYKCSNISQKLTVKLNGTQIKEEVKVKYLGMYIDANLKWASHIEQLSVILSRNIGAINRSKYLLNKQSLLMLYNALVLPYISYCCIIWGFTYPTYISKIETLQKRMVRIIDGQHRLAHSDPIFKGNNILKVKDIARHQLITVMHKKFTETLPNEIESLFTLTIAPNIMTRSRRHFTETFTEKLYGTRVVSWIGPRLWNSVIAPHFSITDIRTSSKYWIKKYIKKCFIESYILTE